MNYRDFIPPIIYKLRRNNKKYSNYEQALQLCSKDDYQNSELCSIIAQKTKIYINTLKEKPIHLQPMELFFLAALNQYISKNNITQLTLLDFGGACGAHYFYFRRFISDNIKLKWIVVETQKMVESAKTINLNNSELIFYDSLDQIEEKVDFIHSSSTLNYLPNPDLFLEKLLNFNAKMIILLRISINPLDTEYVTIQKSRFSENGPGPLPPGFLDKTISYPHNTISNNHLQRIMVGKYRLEWEFDDKSYFNNSGYMYEKN